MAAEPTSRPLAASLTDEKGGSMNARTKEIEHSENLVYENTEEEPELHMKTYIALAAMFMLNMVQLVALQGPPTLLDSIGIALNATDSQTWVVNALVVVQAVVGPLVSSASDLFQARKYLLVGSCLISLIGAGIAPGSQNIYRLIAAQVLIGFGFAAVPLAYAVPSEILPRRWRPATQAAMNLAACLSACLGPVIIGAFTLDNPLEGWRNFYWVQMGLWGVTAVGIFLGYQPPKRHTKFDHLSFMSKLLQLDLVGCGLLCVGLSTFLAGICLEGALYPWTNAIVLAPLIVGLVVLIGFGFYEAYGTETGVIHHDLFSGPNTNGRVMVICMILIAVESVLAYAYLIFYPPLITTLLTTAQMGIVGRLVGFWVSSAIGSIISGYFSTRYRTVPEPLAVGFLIFTGAIVGFACILPGFSVATIAFGCMAGLGFGSALILLVSAVQLSTPHHLIATATAVLTATRAVFATVLTAIYAAALRERLNTKLPAYIAQATTTSGLAPQTVTLFSKRLSATAFRWLSYIGFGRRVSLMNDSIAQVALKFMEGVELVMPGMFPMETVPFLIKLPRRLYPPASKLITNFKKFNRFFLSLSREAAATPHENFAKMLHREPGVGNLTDQEICFVTGNLIGGGVDTTASTTISFLLAMCAFHEVQKKAQAIIDEVVGSGRMPDWTDEPNLRYIRACVDETLRWRTVTILRGIPHAPNQDDEYQCYRIPRELGSQAVNNWSINRNPAEFPDPDAFNPDRFIGPQAPFPTKKGHNAFRWRRRVCSGQALAEQGLLLSFARLLWAFDIRPGLDDQGRETPVDIFAYGESENMRPEPFKARFIPRSQQHSDIVFGEAAQASEYLRQFESESKVQMETLEAV